MDTHEMFGIEPEMKCLCGATAAIKLEDKTLDLNGLEVYVKGYPAYHCDVCGEVYEDMRVLLDLDRAVFQDIVTNHILTPQTLRFCRLVMQMSQEELARRAGLRGGRSLMSLYESGAKKPSTGTVQTLGLLFERWLDGTVGNVPIPLPQDIYTYSKTTPKFEPIVLPHG